MDENAFGDPADLHEELFGDRPSPVTLWRWRVEGFHGIRLRYVAIGRKVLTTRRWLIEFAEAKAAAESGVEQAPKPLSIPALTAEPSRKGFPTLFNFLNTIGATTT